MVEIEMACFWLFQESLLPGLGIEPSPAASPLNLGNTEETRLAENPTLKL